MATAQQGSKDDWDDLYSNFEPVKVGPGSLEPNIYATNNYARLKQDTLLIGGLSEILYLPFFVDKEPLLLSMKIEPQYNTVLGFNLRYVPQNIRIAMVNVVFETNQNRIRNDQSLFIDYNLMKRRVPESQYIVRRYKLPMLRVLGNIPLQDWTAVIAQTSGFENVWRQNQQ